MKAVIFDMDGVIADTERIHAEAKQEVLSDYGIDLDLKEIQKFEGKPSEKMFQQLFNDYGIEADPEEAANQKREIYYELIDGEVKEIPGVSELIKELSDSYPLVLASTSTPRNIQIILDSLGLHGFFEDEISGKEAGLEGKPAPDIYQEATKRLDIKPENSIAIEDSENGVESASRAGLNVVGYKIDTENVDATIHSFEEVSPEKLIEKMK